MRVLAVVPRGDSPHSMIFAERTNQSLEQAGVAVSRFELRSRTRPAALLADARRFRQAVRELRPHLVHAQYGSATAAFAVLLAPVPVVITYCGSDLNPCPAMPRLRSWTARLLSQLSALGACGLVAVSDEVRRRLWWRRSRARVIPSPVDLDAFRPQDRLAARAALGWPAEARVLLFNAGRSPRVKRLDLAERVAGILAGRVERFRFEVLRGGVDPARVPVYMNAADCLLLTSDYEGSPNVVKEAVAVGLPVVSVPCGDVEEILDGVQPSAVVSRDAERLAAAVAEIFAAGRRSNGRVTAVRFSTATHGAQLRELYEAALAHARRDS